MLVLNAKVTDPEDYQNYSVQVERVWHNVDAKPIYTVYETVVTRSDGTSWRVPLRYSTVRAVREQLVQACPALRKDPFPKKTYFDWLCCYSQSRFSREVVAVRQEAIQRFLNTALHLQVQCETLLALLHILRP